MAGRPVEYTPEMLDKVEEYIQEAIPQNMKIPTIEGISLKLGISRETVYDWARKYPAFSDTLERIKVLQKEHLTEIGIFGGKEINANIVALFLKANHGMVETVRNELTGADGQPITLVAGGYIPPTGAFSTSPKGSDLQPPTSIQSLGMASESQEDNNSSNGTNTTGTV